MNDSKIDDSTIPDGEKTPEQSAVNEELSVRAAQYTIEPGQSIVVFYIKTPIIPESRPNVRVVNVGRAAVHAEYWWGTLIKWNGIISAATIPAGDTAVLNSGSNALYYSEVRIFNKTSTRAIVDVSKA